MKRLFKLFIAFNIIFFTIEETHACGPYLSNNETHFCLFGVEHNNYKGLQPFYYSEYFLNSFIPDPQGLDYQKNCEEWYAYIKDPNVSMQDIYAFQYKTNADTFLANYYSDNWLPLRRNSFIKYLLAPKNKKVLDYFLLAKKIEQTQDGLMSIWEKDIAPHNQDSMQSYAQQALQMSNKTKDVFLKQRYTFQAIKMCYYGGLNKTVANNYKKQFEKVIKDKNTVVNGWGYLFYGLLQEDSMKRIEALLNAFDLSEEKKVYCYKALLYTDKDQLYKHFTDPRMREIIIALKGMSNYGKAIKDIQLLHAINPKSKYLPVLISREVNKVETWIWSYDYLGFDNTYLNDTQFSYRWIGEYNVNYHKDINYLNLLTAEVAKMHTAQNKKEPYLSLALAHLYNIQGNYQDAKKVLDLLQPNENDYYYNQYLIEQVMVKSNLEDINNATLKSYFAHALQKLNSLKNVSTQDSYWYDLSVNEQLDDADELMLYLSKQYQKVGDIVTAGLLYQKSTIAVNEYGKDVYYVDSTQNTYGAIVFFDKYATIEHIYQLMVFKNKKEKTPFEKLISPNIWSDDDFFLDLIGTKYMRDENYKKALAVFEKIKPDFWESTYFYKDYIPTESIFDLGYLAPWDSVTYNSYSKVSKKEIVADLVAIEDKIANPNISNEQLAMYYYQLGNAKINMTYNGSFWMMISYGNFYGENMTDKGNYYTYSFYPNYIKYGAQYYHGSTATIALDKAYDLSKNNNLKTKIYCSKRLNEFINGLESSSSETKYSQAKSTKLFQLVAIQCPYL